MIRRIGVAFVFFMAFLILVAEVQRYEEIEDAALVAPYVPDSITSPIRKEASHEQ